MGAISRVSIQRIESLKADGIFHTCQQVMKVLHKEDFPLRKEWAEMFLREENKEVSTVLFAKLDGKDEKRVIWKMVKPMIKNGHGICTSSLLR